MRTIAVIQARQNSTRLPGKINLPLAGKSMLQNVIERVERAKLIDQVVVARPEDYPCDENDLVSRFLLCARKYQADRIIRVCADNPCVEPDEIDHLASFSQFHQILLMNSEDPDNDHDGFGGELYSIAMLEYMDEYANRLSYREHPHKFWIDNDKYKYVGQPYPKGFRLDVNTQADYEKLKEIFEHFGHSRFTIKEARDYLETHLEERSLLPGERSNDQHL